jgi:hypothetical protein
MSKAVGRAALIYDADQSIDVPIWVVRHGKTETYFRRSDRPGYIARGLKSWTDGEYQRSKGSPVRSQQVYIAGVPIYVAPLIPFLHGKPIILPEPADAHHWFYKAGWNTAPNLPLAAEMEEQLEATA